MLIPKECNSIDSAGPIKLTPMTTSPPALANLVPPKTATSHKVTTDGKSSFEVNKVNDVHMESVSKGPLIKSSSFKSSKQKGGNCSSKSNKSAVTLKDMVMKVRSRTTTKEKSKSSKNSKSVPSVKKKANSGLELVSKDSLALDDGNSRLSSVGFIPSSLANRKEVKEKRRSIQRLKGCAKYLDVSLMIFGFYFFTLGMYDYLLPDENQLIKEAMHHHYFFTFGLISLIPLLGSPFGYLTMRCRSQCLLLTSMLGNIIFLLGGILYLLIYLLAIKPPGLTSEILYLIQVGIFLAQSVMMSVVHGLLLKQMGVIRVVMKKHVAEKEAEDEEEKQSNSSNKNNIKTNDQDKTKKN